MNAQMIYNDETVHPETITDLILHGDSTAKDILDNFQGVPMSEFGQKLATAASFAEVCRLMHHNYTFAKDLTDSVEWNINGAPVKDSTHAAAATALHTSNQNYIWRPLKFGDTNFTVEFDAYCTDLNTDPNRNFFRIYDNIAKATAGAVRHYYILYINDNNQVEFRYLIQNAVTNAGAGGSYWWGALVEKAAAYPQKSLNSVKHIKLTCDKSNNRFGVSVDNSSFVYTDSGSTPIANKTWQIWLGGTAEAWIDNFKFTNNSTVVSELDFNA